MKPFAPHTSGATASASGTGQNNNMDPSDPMNPANVASSASEDELWDDSDDSGSLMTDTTSLREYLHENIYEDGRRFSAHHADTYLFPNDELEQDRLDLMHHIFKLNLKGKLFLAPIGDNPQRILDVGTGTGIWAIEMADLFPSASVIGTDLSPIQPNWVPPNLEFQIDDAELDWTFDDDTFDMVHVRYMRGTVADWPRLMTEALRVLKPGGYVEYAEPDIYLRSDDNSVPENYAPQIFMSNFHDGNEKNGRPSRGIAQKMKSILQEVGYTEVKETIIKCPQNHWPKDPEMKHLGRYSLLNFLDGLEALSAKLFTTKLDMEKSDIGKLIEKVKVQSGDRKVHSYFNYHYVYGMKPVK